MKFKGVIAHAHDVAILEAVSADQADVDFFAHADVFNEELALLSEEAGMLGGEALIGRVAQIALGSSYEKLMIEQFVTVANAAVRLNVLQLVGRNEPKLRRGTNDGVCGSRLRCQLRIPDDLEDIALLALSFEGKFPQETRLYFAATGNLLLQRI